MGQVFNAAQNAGAEYLQITECVEIFINVLVQTCVQVKYQKPMKSKRKIKKSKSLTCADHGFHEVSRLVTEHFIGLCCGTNEI
jgi:hypothetical protein